MEKAPMNLKLTPRSLREGVASLDLEGEVDVFTAPSLRQAIMDQAENGSKQLLVNLEKVEYLDSTGLGILIGGNKRLAEAGGALLLVGPSARIRRLFEITQLNTILRIFDNEADALAA
jgi:anti-sigma B factor antagonist